MLCSTINIMQKCKSWGTCQWKFPFPFCLTARREPILQGGRSGPGEWGAQQLLLQQELRHVCLQRELMNFVIILSLPKSSFFLKFTIYVLMWCTGRAEGLVSKGWVWADPGGAGLGRKGAGVLGLCCDWDVLHRAVVTLGPCTGILSPAQGGISVVPRSWEHWNLAVSLGWEWCDNGNLIIWVPV